MYFYFNGYKVSHLSLMITFCLKFIYSDIRKIHGLFLSSICLEFVYLFFSHKMVYFVGCKVRKIMDFVS